MASYWKHKNLTIFSYGQEGSARPEQKDPNQAIRDWHRLAKAPETCPFYIHIPEDHPNFKELSKLRDEEGYVKLSSLRPHGFKAESPEKASQGLNFSEEERNEFRAFLKTYLFLQYKNDKETQESLVDQALFHLHQAGLPHATNFCVNHFQTSEPLARVNFKPTEKGLLIQEKNIYKELTKRSGAKDIAPEGKYHAKTTTTYLFTSEKITLEDLEIDCPSSKAAAIFDKRSLLDQLRQYIQNLIADWKGEPQNTLAESKEIYSFKS